MVRERCCLWLLLLLLLPARGTKKACWRYRRVFREFMQSPIQETAADKTEHTKECVPAVLLVGMQLSISTR
jgi:hypothetical protein